MKTFFVCEWVWDDEMDDRPNPHIEMVGVFSTKEKAVAECLTDQHFYGEFILDQSNHETKPWPTKDEYPKRKSINCPKCGWVPDGKPHWGCEKCGTTFDTFETKAKCPNEECGNSWELTQCIACGKRIPHKDWYSEHR